MSVLCNNQQQTCKHVYERFSVLLTLKKEEGVNSKACEGTYV